MLRKQTDGSAVSSYAWIILAVIFLGQAAALGTRMAFGAYIAPWEQTFSASRTAVTSISTISFVVFAVAQPLAGKLNDRFGKSTVPSVSLFLMGISLLLTARAEHLWQVFLFYGVGFSLGVSGCGNVIAVAVLPKWFVKKRGFALGIAMSGMAVGQLLLVPANLFLVERLGWRAAMSVLSVVIMAVVGPLNVFLLRSHPEERGMRPYGYEESGQMEEASAPAPRAEPPLPLFSVFKRKAFWYLSIPYFICGVTDVGIISTHLIPMTQERGFPATSAALAFSLIALTNIGGTIITGHMSDHFNRRRQLAMLYILRGGTYVLLIFLHQPWLLMVFAVLFGAVEMASIAPTNSLAVQYFERYSLGAVLGLISVSHQVGGAVGSWLPGLLYDLTGSYSSVPFIAIALLLAAALLSLRAPA